MSGQCFRIPPLQSAHPPTSFICLFFSFLFYFFFLHWRSVMRSLLRQLVFWYIYSFFWVLGQTDTVLEGGCLSYTLRKVWKTEELFTVFFFFLTQQPICRYFTHLLFYLLAFCTTFIDASYLNVQSSFIHDILHSSGTLIHALDNPVNIIH